MPMDFIQSNILLIAIAVISTVMLLMPSLRHGGKAISPAQATLLINREDAVVVDVREPAEYSAGHVSDSRNIPFKDLASRVSELEAFKEKPVIFVCASGSRSGQACAQLKKLGFTNLNNLDGGIQSWERAGLPIKRGSKKK